MEFEGIEWRGEQRRRRSDDRCAQVKIAKYILIF